MNLYQARAAVAEAQLPGEVLGYISVIETENETLKNLLQEWIVEGRFLVGNCAEEIDLVRRSKEALGTMERV
jgi:hypothetical protein